MIMRKPFVAAVPTPATLRADASVPYPALMAKARVDGVVTLSFIVDPDARVDTTSFAVYNSTHDLFTAASREMIVNGKVTAARIGDRMVRQMVTHTFVFEPSDSAADCRRSWARLDTTFVCAKR